MAAYTYNASGLRIQKTVGNTVTSYEYIGDRLVNMSINNGTSVTSLGFVYDLGGQVIGFTTPTAEYFYVKDILGNILGLIDKNGLYVVKYTYDTWGKVLSTDVINTTDTAIALNPFKYKGYFHDDETGWYYLKSTSCNSILFCVWILNGGLMKKFLIMLLCLLFIFSATGCEGEIFYWEFDDAERYIVEIKLVSVESFTKIESICTIDNNSISQLKLNIEQIAYCKPPFWSELQFACGKGFMFIYNDDSYDVITQHTPFIVRNNNGVENFQWFNLAVMHESLDFFYKLINDYSN